MAAKTPEIAMLAEAARIVARARDVDSTLLAVLALLRSTYGFDHAGVRLLDARGLLPIRVRIGLDIDYADQTSMVPTRETMYGRAFLDGEPVVVPDASDHPASTHFEFLNSLIKVKALIHMPMVADGKPVGVLMAYSSAGPFDFTADVVEAFWTLATLLAAVVTSTNLHGQVASLSAAVDEKVRKRTAQLEAANERLTELDRLKSEFLSDVSHELRTPLTSIQSFSEILMNYELPDTEKRKSFAKVVFEESQRLTRMIDDLLDLSRIEAGRLEIELEPVGLEAVVRKAVESTAPLFDRNKVTVTANVEPDLSPVRANRDRLLQVFTNLLGNAAKFAPYQSSVRIKARRRGRFAMVSVADEGQGIDPAQFREVFDRYRQIRDPGQRSSVGTGLGLAISRELVESFGGYIWVESFKRRGATFYFTLPFA